MEKENFLITCNEVSSLHIPRWKELPEFELYMDQVIGLAEKYLSVLSIDGKGMITPSMINNYVKSGVLPPPKNKKYNRTHLALLMIVCITKPVMELSAIADLLHRDMKDSDVETVLDTLAAKFEGELADAARNAAKTFATSGKDSLGLVAIENMLKANAARTVAMHAYRAVAPSPEPAAEKDKSEKAEKKAEKKNAKAKKEQKSAENTEMTEATDSVS